MPLQKPSFKSNINNADPFNGMDITEQQGISSAHIAHNSNGRHTTMKESNHNSDGRVQWTVKSLMDPNNSKGFSNFNSWLSSQKRNADGKQVVNSYPNGNAYSTSGFDLTKLYPELSSKLGLTKTQTGETVTKQVVKNCQTIKRYSDFNSSTTKGIDAKLNSIPCTKPTENATVQKAVSNAVKKNQKVNKIVPNNLNSIRPPRKKAGAQTLDNNCIIENFQKCKTSSFENLQYLVKRKTKNTQQELRSSKVHSWGTTYPPASGSTQKPSVINILPRRPPILPKVEGLSSSQLRVQSMYQNYYAYTSDLFPLGFENLDNEPNDTNLVSCSLPSSNLLVNGDTVDDPSSSYRHSSLLSCSRRQLLSAKEGFKLQNDTLAHRYELSQSLIDAARSNPMLSASVVTHFTRNPSHSNYKKQEKKYRSTLLTQRGCVYELSEGTACEQKALPGTRHCVRHITYNVDQQLFSQCSAKSDNNMLCRIPTFDVLHSHPVCELHMDYAEEITTAPQPPPEVKRPRKKNKMPILCRYGKRSKKRRRSSTNSSVVPSTCVRPPINPPSICLGSPQPASPFTPRASPTLSHHADSGKTEDSEFEEDLEVMDGGLTLDDAATRLLDKDLKDVFNNFGDNELTNIFYGPETKSEAADDKGAHTSSESARRTSQVSAVPIENSEDMPLSLDSNALGELSGNGCIDSIISSSFNQAELNTISQVLSNMVQDETLNLASFQLPTPPPPFAADVKSDSVPMDATENFAKKESQSDSVLEPVDTGVACKLSLVKQANKLQTDLPTLPPLQ